MKVNTGAITNGPAIRNSDDATVGNVYLYKRTALYAWLFATGKPLKKISVPAGTDTIKFVHG